MLSHLILTALQIFLARITIPISQLRKLRLREIKRFAKCTKVGLGCTISQIKFSAQGRLHCPEASLEEGSCSRCTTG